MLHVAFMLLYLSLVFSFVGFSIQENSSHPWPNFRGGIEGGGHSSLALPAACSASPRQRYVHSSAVFANAELFSHTTAAADGAVYFCARVAAEDSQPGWAVFGVNASTGEALWESRTFTGVSGAGPALLDSWVVITRGGGGLGALDAATGELVLERDGPTMLHPPIAVENGGIVGSNAGEVFFYPWDASSRSIGAAVGLFACGPGESLEHPAAVAQVAPGKFHAFLCTTERTVAVELPTPAPGDLALSAAVPSILWESLVGCSAPPLISGGALFVVGREVAPVARKFDLAAENPGTAVALAASEGLGWMGGLAFAALAGGRGIVPPLPSSPPNGFLAGVSPEDKASTVSASPLVRVGGAEFLRVERASSAIHLASFVLDGNELVLSQRWKVSLPVDVRTCDEGCDALWVPPPSVGVDGSLVLAVVERGDTHLFVVAAESCGFYFAALPSYYTRSGDSLLCAFDHFSPPSQTIRDEYIACTPCEDGRVGVPEEPDLVSTKCVCAKDTEERDGVCAPCGNGALTMGPGGACFCDENYWRPDRSLVECVQCPTNSFRRVNDTEASCVCTRVGELFFSGACNECPLHSEWSAQEGECLCNIGFFHVPTTQNTACGECVDGMRCREVGTLSPPVAEDGFFRDGLSYTPCTFKDRCVNGSCAHPYTGAGCTQCVENYAVLSDDCVQCAAHPWIPLVAIIYVYLIVIAVVSWRPIAELSRLVGGDGENDKCEGAAPEASRQNSLACVAFVAVVNFQFMALAFDLFDLRWTPALQRHISYLSLFQLAPDVGSPECVSPFPYFARWLFSLALPIFLAGPTTASYLWKLRAVSDGTRKVAFAGLWTLYIRAIEVTFFVLCRTAIAPFDCTTGRTAGGGSVFSMDKNPSITCWSSGSARWVAMAFLGSFVIVFVMIGLPIFALLHIRSTRAKGRPTHIALQPFVAMYQARAWYWGFVVLFARTTMVSIGTFLTQRVTWQAITAMTLLGILLVLQVFLRPFCVTSANILGGILQFATLAVFSMGWITEFARPEGTGSHDAITSLVWITICIAVCAVVITVFFEWNRGKTKIVKNEADPA